ncbi:MAG TPA: peptidylprolyl isomerase [Verrucomicrobiae bacterium]|jgi:cyclophilin family peptidyl-prolyl cis-trans isomerase|nr:peptidylprolyl isomerase [Verrucomicrobiae bacterium]
MTKATIETTKGTIVVELDDVGTPKAAGNFIKLAKQGQYNGVIFHRVIPGFVVQGGDVEHGRLDEKGKVRNAGRVGQGGPGYRFEDEPFTGDYERGALAMANAGPNTNGSQFFICHQDLRGKLPKKYTRFGVVLSGMDVVDAIAAAPRSRDDFPESPVAMTSVTIDEA